MNYSTNAENSESKSAAKNVSELLNDLDLGDEPTTTGNVPDLSGLDDLIVEYQQDVKTPVATAQCAAIAIAKLEPLEDVAELLADLDLSDSATEWDGVTDFETLVERLADERVVAPTEASPLQKAMRAYQTKHAAPVATPGDPLAVDKVKVGRYLKKHGLTPDVLPEGFYELPSYVERQNELHRIVSEHKRVAAAERERHLAAERQRRHREKITPKAITKPARGIPLEAVSREWMAEKITQLRAWIAAAISDHSAVKLRDRERELTMVAAHYHRLHAALGREPSQDQLAAKIGGNRRTAQNKLRILVSLYSRGGPWHAEA